MPLAGQSKDGCSPYLRQQRKEVVVMSPYEILMVVLTIAILIVEIVKLVYNNKK